MRITFSGQTDYTLSGSKTAMRAAFIQAQELALNPPPESSIDVGFYTSKKESHVVTEDELRYLIQAKKTNLWLVKCLNPEK